MHCWHNFCLLHKFQLKRFLKSLDRLNLMKLRILLWSQFKMQILHWFWKVKTKLCFSFPCLLLCIIEEYHSWWTWRRKMEKDSWAEYTLWLLQFTVVARMSFLFENLRCKVKSGASETENEKKNFYQKSFWTFSWNMKNYFFQIRFKLSILHFADPKEA